MKYFKVKFANKNNILLNVPHSSVKIPKEFKKSFILNKKDLRLEKKSMADLYTKELFSDLLKKYDSIVMDVSRLVVDIERFADEKKETMSKVGMSATYTKSQHGDKMRDLSLEDKKNLLDKIYWPYHNKLGEITSVKNEKYGSCLIVDCHSFPDIPRSYEPDQKKNRPDICIGSDSFHVPLKIQRELIKGFKRCDFSVKINTPFAGSIVPNMFFERDENVKSIMIEVNRKLYMDEKTFKKNKNFAKVSKLICSTISKAISEIK